MNSIRPGIHGDTVKVIILPYHKWIASSSIDMIYSEEEDIVDSLDVNESDESNESNESNESLRIITGKVIEVVKTGNREFVCSVLSKTEG